MSHEPRENDRRHMLCALALAAKGGWRVAPNPVVAGDRLRLIPAGTEQPTAVRLLDASGRLVRELRVEEALEGHVVSDLAAGTYLLHLLFEQRQQSIRWIKG